MRRTLVIFILALLATIAIATAAKASAADLVFDCNAKASNGEEWGQHTLTIPNPETNPEAFKQNCDEYGDLCDDSPLVSGGTYVMCRHRDNACWTTDGKKVSRTTRLGEPGDWDWIIERKIDRYSLAYEITSYKSGIGVDGFYGTCRLVTKRQF